MRLREDVNFEFEDHRHLQAAEGYVALGMYLEAHNELEAMSRNCRFRHDVLLVRFGIYRGIGNSDLMEMVALQLVRAGFRVSQPALASAHLERRTAGNGGRETVKHLRQAASQE